MAKTIKYEKVGKLDGEDVFTRHIDTEPEVKNEGLDKEFEVYSKQNGRTLYKKKPARRSGRAYGDPMVELG